VAPHPNWVGDLEWWDLLSGGMPVLAVIVGLWLANVALTGWLAGRRGRDDGLWAVLALFLGPLALIAVLVLPPKRARAPG
jgi:hypothetical protein